MKWNSSGTSLLFLSSTDHDKTGKSYYGETNLYLLTPALQYVAQVTLDKEGGIGDFAWNPANGGKEFAVSYGFVPAKTTLFDLRLNVLHDFGSHPRNFVSFNPQGRLLCIAGFGNLAGQVDIWDRSTLKKVANFQASNCTECTWSPDGRFMMMSTLSPRLRVDNGVKIHHWSGELIHADLIEECYQVRRHVRRRTIENILTCFSSPITTGCMATSPINRLLIPASAIACPATVAECPASQRSEARCSRNRRLDNAKTRSNWRISTAGFAESGSA